MSRAFNDPTSVGGESKRPRLVLNAIIEITDSAVEHPNIPRQPIKSDRPPESIAPITVPTVAPRISWLIAICRSCGGERSLATPRLAGEMAPAAIPAITRQPRRNSKELANAQARVTAASVIKPQKIV